MFSTIRPNYFLLLNNFICSDLKPSSLVRIISFQLMQNHTHSKSGLCRDALGTTQNLAPSQDIVSWQQRSELFSILCVLLPMEKNTLQHKPVFVSLSLHFSQVDQLQQAVSRLCHSCSLNPFSTCSTHLKSSDTTQTPIH